MNPDRERPKTRAELEALVWAHFPEDAETINGCLLPALTFVPRPRADGRVALRLGGGVRLPAAVPWPVNGDRDLYFLGEVDMTVAGPLDVTGALPTSGSLLFFF
ncbi:MAG TPA: hypothetical protein VFV63_01240, partial [Ilumatobacteraceae bacterium]|nr:hypothetical protein [Ilumatobacteraceae bacterium]